MYEITYCSSASPNLRAEGISDILEKAQHFNSKHDITGCLLYHNQEFIQILEGEEDASKEAVEKLKQIRQDIRDNPQFSPKNTRRIDVLEDFLWVVNVVVFDNHSSIIESLHSMLH